MGDQEEDGGAGRHETLHPHSPRAFPRAQEGEVHRPHPGLETSPLVTPHSLAVVGCRNRDLCYQ